MKEQPRKEQKKKPHPGIHFCVPRVYTFPVKFQ